MVWVRLWIWEMMHNRWMYNNNNHMAMVCFPSQLGIVPTGTALVAQNNWDDLSLLWWACVQTGVIFSFILFVIVLCSVWRTSSVFLRSVPKHHKSLINIWPFLIQRMIFIQDGEIHEHFHNILLDILMLSFLIFSSNETVVTRLCVHHQSDIFHLPQPFTIKITALSVSS